MRSVEYKRPFDVRYGDLDVRRDAAYAIANDGSSCSDTLTKIVVVVVVAKIQPQTVICKNQ